MSLRFIGVLFRLYLENECPFVLLVSFPFVFYLVSLCFYWCPYLFLFLFLFFGAECGNMFLPFFFLLCVAFGFTNGRNVYVEQGQGTDGYGTLSQPYGSITQAFENSRDGDIIMIETGVYTDFGLVMGSPLLEISFLYFDSGGHEPNCVIDLSSNTEGVPFLENHLSSANVTIDGLVFKNNPFGSIISFTDGLFG